MCCVLLVPCINRTINQSLNHQNTHIFIFQSFYVARLCVYFNVWSPRLAQRGSKMKMRVRETETRERQRLANDKHFTRFSRFVLLHCSSGSLMAPSLERRESWRKKKNKTWEFKSHFNSSYQTTPLQRCSLKLDRCLSKFGDINVETIWLFSGLRSRLYEL